MTKEGTSDRSKNLNVIKFGALLILALVIVVYSILLFTGSFGKDTANTPKKVATAQEIKTAKQQIETLLSAPFVKAHSEINNALIIKIDTNLWKKLSMKERKTYVADMAAQMSVTETSPVVKITDIKSGMEYASYEYNRVSLAELGF
ncbi:MAG: hypothetical protein HQK97_07355 [Nitrospirae bacterium]|nr:hypothetical protein [Nitrospirota bacterium]